MGAVVSSAHATFWEVVLRGEAGGVDWIWGEAEGASTSLYCLTVSQAQQPLLRLSTHLDVGGGLPLL